MSRWSERAIIVLLAVGTALCVTPRPGGAQLVDEENVGRLTIGFGIGILIPSMSEVNGNIDVVNPFLVREEIRELDHVSESLLTGLDVRYRLGNTPKMEDEEGPIRLLDRLSVGFNWGAVSARSQLDVSRAFVRFFSRATTYYPYVLYHLPFLDTAVPRAQLVVGGGPLLLRSGRVEWQLADKTANNFFPDIEDGVGDLSELTGNGKATADALGFALQGGGTFMLNNRFSIGVDVGYRLAKLSDLEITDAEGQAELRFPNPEDVPVTRRPGDWAIIDFFKRDPNAEFEGRKRTDPPTADPETGGCDGCPLYYRGGGLEVDYSGPFANITLRTHF